MTLAGTWLPDRSLPWAGDLAGGGETGFRESLFLRKVVVFDKSGVIFGSRVCSGVVVVVGGGAVGWGCMELREEEIVDESDLRGERFDC